MTVLGLLSMLAALQVKHMFADFWWQTETMIRDKPRYGAAGGVRHAALHGALSVPVLWLFGGVLLWALVLGLIETVVHYHLDWLKARQGVRARTDPQDSAFWRAIGVDQLAHQLTYLALAAAVSAQTSAAT